MEEEEIQNIQNEALDFASEAQTAPDQFREDYNRTGSLTGGISENDMEEYQRLNVPLTEDSKAQWDQKLGENQAWTEQALNAAGQVIAKIPATVIQNFASLADADMIFHPDPGKIENSLYDAMEEYKNSVDESIPIYRSNPGESFAFGDSGWWYKNIAGTVESATAFVLSSYMTGAAVGKVLTGAFRGGKYLAAALNGKDAAVAARFGAAMGANASKGIQTIGAIVNAATSNHMEGFGVATQVAKSAKQYALSQGKTEEEANKIAAESAAIAYNTNQYNILLNISSAGAFMTAPRHTRQLLKEMTILGGAKNVGIETAQEALEESVNNIAEKRGMAYAKGKKYGTDEAMSDMFSEEGLESAFWGAIGGAGQTALTGVSQAIPMQRDAEGNRTSKMAINNKRYLKQQETIAKYNEVAKANGAKEFTAAFQDSIEFSKTLDNLQEAIKANDKDAIATQQSKLVEHQAFNAFEMGTTEKLIEMYASISRSEAQEGMDNDPESDGYYKKKAKQAIDKIKALEEVYIDSDGYRNGKTVFLNRTKDINANEKKKELEKEKVAAELALSNLLMKENQEQLRKEIPLLRDNIVPDTKSFTMEDVMAGKALNNTPEYAEVKRIEEGIENIEQQIKDLDSEYKTLISPEEQRRVKAEQEKLERELAKAKAKDKKDAKKEIAKNLNKKAKEKAETEEKVIKEGVEAAGGETTPEVVEEFDEDDFKSEGGQEGKELKSGDVIDDEFDAKDFDPTPEELAEIARQKAEEEARLKKLKEQADKDKKEDTKEDLDAEVKSNIISEEDQAAQDQREAEIYEQLQAEAAAIKAAAEQKKANDIIKEHVEIIEDNDLAGIYTQDDNKMVDDLIEQLDESMTKVNAVSVGDDIEYTGKTTYAPASIAYLTRDYKYVTIDGRVSKQDIDDNLLSTFDTALMSLSEGDEVSVRVYDNDDVEMNHPFTGEKTTWGVVKADPRVQANLSEYIPIGVFIKNKGGSFKGEPSAYIHLPSWITPETTDSRKVPLDRQISDLRALRSVINEKGEVNTKIDFISNGSLIRTHDGSYNPTTVLGQVPLAIMRDGNLVKKKEGKPIKTINTIPLSKEGMLVTIIPTKNGNIAAPVRRNKLSEDHVDSIVSAVELWLKSNSKTPLTQEEQDLLDELVNSSDFDFKNMSGQNSLADYIRHLVYLQHIEHAQEGSKGATGGEMLSKLQSVTSDVFMFGTDGNSIYWGQGTAKKLKYINKNSIDNDKISQEDLDALLENLRKSLKKTHINASFLMNQDGAMNLPLIKDGKVEVITQKYVDFLKENTSTNLLKFDVDGKPVYTIQPVINIGVDSIRAKDKEAESNSVSENLSVKEETIASLKKDLKVELGEFGNPERAEQIKKQIAELIKEPTGFEKYSKVSIDEQRTFSKASIQQSGNTHSATVVSDTSLATISTTEGRASLEEAIDNHYKVRRSRQLGANLSIGDILNIENYVKRLEQELC
jgi:hypothetical protein